MKLYELAKVIDKLIESNIGNPQEELAALEKQLATLYKSIAEKYKLMSKVSDGYRLDVMQSGIDQALAQAKAVRERIDALRKSVIEDWSKPADGSKF